MEELRHQGKQYGSINGRNYRVGSDGTGAGIASDEFIIKEAQNGPNYDTDQNSFFHLCSPISDICITEFAFDSFLLHFTSSMDWFQ
jgi:hypothetical protein